MDEVAEDIETIYKAAAAMRPPTVDASPAGSDDCFEAAEDNASSFANVSPEPQTVAFTPPEEGANIAASKFVSTPNYHLVIRAPPYPRCKREMLYYFRSTLHPGRRSTL